MFALMFVRLPRLTCYDEPPPNPAPNPQNHGDDYDVPKFSQRQLNEIESATKRSHLERIAAERRAMKEDLERIQADSQTTASEKLRLQGLVDQLALKSGEAQNLLDSRQKAYDQELAKRDEALNKTQSAFNDYRVSTEVSNLLGAFNPYNGSQALTLFMQDCKPVFKAADTDPATGEPRGERVVVLDGKGKETPVAESIEKWTNKPGNANLFKSGIIAGSGSASVSGRYGYGGQQRDLDYTQVDMQTYLELRNKGQIPGYDPKKLTGRG